MLLLDHRLFKTLSLYLFAFSAKVYQKQKHLRDCKYFAISSVYSLVSQLEAEKPRWQVGIADRKVLAQNNLQTWHKLLDNLESFLISLLSLTQKNTI